MSFVARSGKVKASDLAAEAKKIFIPWIRRDYPQWPAVSTLYLPSDIPAPPALNGPPRVTRFDVVVGDPVDECIAWAAELCADINSPATKPFLICSANERRAGGDWETGVLGYEERLCRRSNLSLALATPVVDVVAGDYTPATFVVANRSPSGTGTVPTAAPANHYPIPSVGGGILSPHVTVFRGPNDYLDPWSVVIPVPVVSVPPARWPKLTGNGTRYSFSAERDLVYDKMRIALRIAIHAGARFVVVADWGLGNAYRNPPMEMATMWRHLFFYDPNIRGRLHGVRFVFEDSGQSTTRAINYEIAKDHARRTGGGGGGGGGGSRSSRACGSAAAAAAAAASSAQSDARSAHEPTDYDIFKHKFDPAEIREMLTATDPRYGIMHLTI
jgi:hypothetical protein